MLYTHTSKYRELEPEKCSQIRLPIKIRGKTYEICSGPINTAQLGQVAQQPDQANWTQLIGLDRRNRLDPTVRVARFNYGKGRRTGSESRNSEVVVSYQVQLLWPGDLQMPTWPCAPSHMAPYFTTDVARTVTALANSGGIPCTWTVTASPRHTWRQQERLPHMPDTCILGEQVLRLYIRDKRSTLEGMLFLSTLNAQCFPLNSQSLI